MKRLPFALPSVFLASGILLSGNLSNRMTFVIGVVVLFGTAAVLFKINRALLSIAVLGACLMTGIVAAHKSEPVETAEVRTPLASYIDGIFPHRLARFSRAVLLAENDVIDDLDRINYRKTGLSHLLAISGFNIAVLAGIFWLCARLLFGDKAITDILALAATLLYTFGIGAPASALRAGVMVAALFASRAMGRKGNILNVLFGAFFITLLFDPRALLDIGFQLSYAATYGLIVWTAPLERLLPSRPSLFWKLIASTTAAQALTLPLVLWHFGEMAPIGFLANLALIPIFGLLFPLIVIALSGFAPVIQLAGLLLEATSAIIDAFASFPGTVFLAPAPGEKDLIALALLAGIPLIASWQKKVVVLASALWLLVILDRPIRDGAWFLDDADRGQGLIFVDGSHATLVDDGVSAGAWSKAISRLHVKEVDTVFVKRPVAFEVNRAIDISDGVSIRAWNVPRTWRSPEIMSLPLERREHPVPIITYRGDTWSYGSSEDATVEVFLFGKNSVQTVTAERETIWRLR